VLDGSACYPAAVSKERTGREDIARTIQVDDGDSLRHRARVAVEQRQRRPMCVVVLGDDVGERARMVDPTFVIGRSRSCELRLSDARISSRHCRIEDRGDGFALVDLGSTNGTSVNGELVTGDRVLRSHDKIEVGDTVIRFELHDAADALYDEEMQRLIHVDDLTGLYQRRRFDRELGELLRHARTSGSPVGLLVLDLDGLKRVNDTHGHLAGAYIISQAGRLIGETIPQGAIAARFGGDEYVAALPGHDLASTTAVAEAIHAAVNAHSFVHEGTALDPGISIGATSFPEHGADARSLFASGDRALYAAKRGGRNRVCVSEG